MGLDQYLMRRMPGKEDKEVLYWRKSNFIHRYFTRDFESENFGDDNLRPFPVTEEDLVELSDTCQKVLENKDEAEELLPTMSGFFFGSTDYGEWYFNDVKKTKHMIDELLKNEPLQEGEEFYYEAWY